MAIQLRIDRIFEREGKIFYKADCGHYVPLKDSEHELNLFDDKILCNNCFYEKVENFQEENPIGSPWDLMHPWKK